MTYSIIEDEAFASEKLRFLINTLRPEWELVFHSDSIAVAKDWFEEGHTCDICFLDIELTDGNCFDLLRCGKPDCPIIFTTAYQEFALRAFKYVSVDYLLKPISEKDLSTALEKFDRFYNSKENNRGTVTSDIITQLSEICSPKPKKGRILISSGDSYSFLNIEDIAWFLSEDKYVLAVDRAGNMKLTSIPSLNDLEGSLDASDFFRVARNVVCSIWSVASVRKFFKGRLNVKLQAGSRQEEVAVSAPRRQAFLDWLDS